MTTLRTCNNRKKGKAFAARPHETMVADYVEDGVPTMHIFWDHGRDRVRGRELRWLRSKRWKACRVIRAEWKCATSEEAGA